MPCISSANTQKGTRLSWIRLETLIQFNWTEIEFSISFHLKPKLWFYTYVCLPSMATNIIIYENVMLWKENTIYSLTAWLDWRSSLQNLLLLYKWHIIYQNVLLSKGRKYTALLYSSYFCCTIILGIVPTYC